MNLDVSIQMINAQPCTGVYNIMRKDVTTLKSYHGDNHFTVCCNGGQVNRTNTEN